jgi:hypothetical protein
MADPNSSLKIATMSSLRSRFARSSLWALESAEAGDAPEGPEAQLRLQRVLRKMQQETDNAGPNVLIAMNDADASLVQSRIAQDADAGKALSTGGIEAQFGEGLTGGDIIGWARSIFDHVNSRHPILRPPDPNATVFADVGRVAVVGDWGTNLYGAPVSAASIKRVGGYEMLLHLGDIYYSGTETETKQRFLDVWPVSASRTRRALNGNHEMYSGGFAYFDHVLPSFSQASSYFALQNTHYLLIGLDTSHSEHDLDSEQTDWVKNMVSSAGSQKVILFSHHQPFSRLDVQGPKLQAALTELLEKQAIAAWYWGHEHVCVLYDKHPRWGLLGRCMGHGGIPSPRKREVTGAPVDRSLSGITWRQLEATAEAPPSLVLDGPNPFVPGEEQKFGPHGYLTLDFNGPNMVERVHLPDGAVVYEAQAL